MFAVSVGIHTLSFLVITEKPVHAVTHSEDEQKKRREAYAFKDCVDTIGFRPVLSADTISLDTTLNDSSRTVPIGHDVGDSNGTVKCGDLSNVLGYIGFDLNTLYYNGTYDPPGDGVNNPQPAAVLDQGKLNDLKSKLNNYINGRMPVTWSEKIRRIRFNLTTICATADGNAVGPNSFEVNGNKFRYTKGAGEMISVGHDYDFAGPNDGEVSCGNIVEEALKLNIFDQSAADILKYEPQCWNVLVPAANTYDFIRACATKLGNEQGHGTDMGSTTGDSGSGGNTGIDCDAVSWNPLKWFMCPLLHLAESAVRQLDNLITYMLTFPTADYFDNSNNSLGNAWGSMRNLSLGLLVIAGLVMVISQAVSWGPFDAYTIKKVMPRLVFAVIFISISLPVLRLLIEFSNVAGVGIRELIERLFNANFSNGVTFNNGALTIGTVAVGAAGLSLGFLGILSLMGTAILAVLIAFLVLTARQLLILMLVIVAPIAIACYILPNTERVWKMWWDFFWRALVAFPIISAFIATGHAFAKVASYSTTVPGSDSTLHDTLASLIAFAAYFGPYFALPFAFRLAGGAVGQIGGLVNDRSRGAFDRLKGFRKQQTAQNLSDMKYGKRFEGKSWIPGSRTAARAFNRSAIGVGTGFKGGFGFGERGRQAIDQTRRLGAADLLKSPEMQGIIHNDDALMAASYANASEAQKELTTRFGGDAERAERAVRAVQSSIGFGKPQSLAAFQAAVDTGTAFENLEDQVSTIARVGGGNPSSVSAMAGFANSRNKQVGRFDLAPGFANLDSLSQVAAGHKVLPSSGSVSLGDAHEAAWNSGSLYQHATAKPKDVTAAAEHYGNLLTTGSAAEKERALVFFKELEALQPNATGDVQKVVKQALDTHRNTIYAETTALAASPASPATDRAEFAEVTRVDPTTGGVVRSRVATGATRPESGAERVSRVARTYERPDPNVI